MTRHAEKLVNGEYLIPCVTGEKQDGLVHLDFNGGEAWVTKHALKQIRYVLREHIDLLQALLQNNAYEDVIESLAGVSKDIS